MFYLAELSPGCHLGVILIFSGVPCYPAGLSPSLVSLTI
jgi:hypothetical protein